MQAVAEDRAIAPAPKGAIILSFYVEKLRRGLTLDNRYQCKAHWGMAAKEWAR